MFTYYHAEGKIHYDINNCIITETLPIQRQLFAAQRNVKSLN